MPKYHHTKLTEITLPTYEDASKLLNVMENLCFTYGYVTVADLHELVGLPTVYLDHKWGWYSLDQVKIVNSLLRHKYFDLVFPPPELIIKKMDDVKTIKLEFRLSCSTVVDKKEIYLANNLDGMISVIKQSLIDELIKKIHSITDEEIRAGSSFIVYDEFLTFDN